VLSHVAIRARSQGVLLATCFDDDAFAELAKLEARRVWGAGRGRGDGGRDGPFAGLGLAAASAAANGRLPTPPQTAKPPEPARQAPPKTVS
jgi:hypothetical protein